MIIRLVVAFVAFITYIVLFAVVYTVVWKDDFYHSTLVHEDSYKERLGKARRLVASHLVGTAVVNSSARNQYFY